MPKHTEKTKELLTFILEQMKAPYMSGWDVLYVRRDLREKWGIHFHMTGDLVVVIAEDAVHPDIDQVLMAICHILRYTGIYDRKESLDMVQDSAVRMEDTTAVMRIDSTKASPSDLWNEPEWDSSGEWMD